MPSGGCGRGAQYRVVYNVRDLLARKFWMKRYFVFLLLIFAFPASASEAFTPAPLNPDFIRWRVSARNEARGADVMLDAVSSAVVLRGAAPAPQDMSYLKDADFSMFLDEVLPDGARPADGTCQKTARIRRPRCPFPTTCERRGASRPWAIRGRLLSAGLSARKRLWSPAC